MLLSQAALLVKVWLHGATPRQLLFGRCWWALQLATCCSCIAHGNRHHMLLQLAATLWSSPASHLTQCPAPVWPSHCAACEKKRVLLSFCTVHMRGTCTDGAPWRQSTSSDRNRLSRMVLPKCMQVPIRRAAAGAASAQTSTLGSQKHLHVVGFTPSCAAGQCV